MATIAIAGFGNSSVLTAEALLPYWNEDFYLAQYPDVQEAIAIGYFSSGLDHFLQVGTAEARDPGFSINLLTPATSFQRTNLITHLEEAVFPPPITSASGIWLPEIFPDAFSSLRVAPGNGPSYIPFSDFLQIDNSVSAKTITVNYGSGFTTEIQQAFQFAVNIWDSLLLTPIEVVIDASFTPLDAGVLAEAGPEGVFANFDNSPQVDTFYPVALANQISNSDLNGATPEITTKFNSVGVNWYFGTDGSPGPLQIDFVSVVLHEIAHGLGFLSSFDFNLVDNQGIWGLENPPIPVIFDRFVENGAGQKLIEDFPNPSVELGSQLTGDDLFFNGPNANEANNRVPPKLYAPDEFDNGSSIAHLDEDTFPPLNPNSLMTPSLAPNEAIHDPGPITLGILQDLGWQLKAVTPNLADLSITKTDTPDPVAKGGTLTYTLTVSNAANGVDATGIEVRDILPTDFTVTDITVGSGGFVAPTLPLASNEITFTNGTLASGASATITITGTAPDTGEFPRTIENTAVVDPDDLIEEANENNNTVTIATQVNSDLPDLTITKADTPDPVLVGGTLTYTLTVTNVAGGVPATNIEVKDTLPSGFNFLSTGVSGGGFTASQSGDIVTFSGGSLADGESATLTITGSAPQEPGTLTNTAVVDPNNQIAERNEDNNTATAMTTVATVPPIPPMPTPPNIPGPGFPSVPGFPNFPGFPPVFVPPALTPTIEPPPGGALPPIYLSTTSPNNFRGTEAPEFIYGGPFDDTIDGAGGNDTILGREGRDLLIGGNGSDKLFGNQGDDRLYGGDGDDTVYGGKDNDFINGERGHDFLRGDLGDDTVRGGDGDDTLYGGKGNDWLLGDKGDDYLSGDLGDDVLDGIGRDRDSVGEIDTLIGGEGSNLFVLGTTHTIYYDDRSPGAGYGDYALIEDFNASQDRLQLKGGVNYLLNFSPNGLPGGTGIYIDDGSTPGVWDEEDELIAVLKDIAPNDNLFARINFV